MLDILLNFLGGIIADPKFIGTAVFAGFFIFLVAIATISGDRHTEAQGRYHAPIGMPEPESPTPSSEDVDGGKVLRFTPRSRTRSDIVSGAEYNFKPFRGGDDAL